MVFDLNPKPLDGTSGGRFRFFRETDTTGLKSLDFLRGNNTTQVSASIGVDGKDSFFQLHGGNFGIGTSEPDDARLHVVGNNFQYGIRADSSVPLGTALFGQQTSAGGVAIRGQATKTFGNGKGVQGTSNSTKGYDFFASGVGQDYGTLSSIRWKSNVRNIDQPLEKVARLRGVYFDWDADHGGHHDVGMIAEEVGEVLPEIVNYEENGIDAIGMDYSKLTPLLVEAVNALRAENETLHAQKDAEITALQQQVYDLRDLVEESVSTFEENKQ